MGRLSTRVNSQAAGVQAQLLHCAIGRQRRPCMLVKSVAGLAGCKTTFGVVAKSGRVPEEKEAEGGSGSAVEGSGKMPSLRCDRRKSERATGRAHRQEPPENYSRLRFFLPPDPSFFSLHPFFHWKNWVFSPFSPSLPFIGPRLSTTFADPRGLVPLDNFLRSPWLRLKKRPTPSSCRATRPLPSMTGPRQSISTTRPSRNTTRNPLSSPTGLRYVGLRHGLHICRDLSLGRK